ncbi:transposase [Botrimarina mediterranea]|uniref:transposase n=1 Tax=Botrimarina mediterranea TaxID=2528022 RepID=UPI00118B563A|nr:Transposase IS200 like protein [Planctomycetes bacterium K2D]
MWYWLLTSTTYGTWLPGDARGSVTSVRDYRPGDGSPATRIEHARYGEAWEPQAKGLRRSAESTLKGPPVLLIPEQAQCLLSEFQRTASHHGWRLSAVALMANHVHLVVGLPRETSSVTALQDFKAYGSRVLNKDFGKPKSSTWWTKSGSRRLLPDEEALVAAINYVLHRQANPLLTWSNSPHSN